MIEPPAISHFDAPTGHRIAYRHAPGDGPLIVFLPGYMSDMDGGKATEVMAWAQQRGRACLLLDYSGCGRSEGDFADGALSNWRDEVLALVAHVGGGAVTLIGSSMGGWLLLMVAEKLGADVASAIGIAAAPDFTDWGYDEAQKSALADGSTIFEDNPYGPEPTPTHARFWSNGQAHRMLDRTIRIAAPVRLIHGQNDGDVPWQTSLRLAEALETGDVRVHLVKDGEHRLSRPGDIALLLTVLEELS